MHSMFPTQAELEVEALLKDFAAKGAWGTIEIEIRGGVPDFVRTTVTKKLAQENNRAEATKIRKQY